MTYLLLLIGLALVIKGGDFFVQAAVGIAEHLKIPRVVVGGTLMALATTSPEIVVSVMSGVKGEPGLALGNASGSVVCNIGLIGGTTALLGTVVTHPQSLKRPFMALGICSVMALLFSLDHEIVRWEAALMVLCGLTYFVGDMYWSLRTRFTGEPDPTATVPAHPEEPVLPIGKSVSLFLVGAVTVIFGSKLLVDSAVTIATNIGISTTIIGLTVVSVGTSLPEFVTAITSARKGVSDLSIGNIIGANVANLTLVLGAAGVLTPIHLPTKELLLNFPPMLTFISILAVLALVKGGISRSWGKTFLALYVVFVALIALTAKGG